MARKRKKKQRMVPEEFIQEVNKMSKDQIVKRFIQEENDLKAMKTIQTHAIITGVRSKVDRSLGLTIATPELTTNERSLFMEYQGIN